MGYAVAAFEVEGEEGDAAVASGVDREQDADEAQDDLAAFELGADPYVALARASVEGFVRTGRTIERPAGLPPELVQARAGVFVSLHEDGELRGCIGTISPVTGSVADEIVRNGVAAASEDPRFPPVRPDELDALAYSVDVLSPSPSTRRRWTLYATASSWPRATAAACCCRTWRAWTRWNSSFPSPSARRASTRRTTTCGWNASRWCATTAEAGRTVGETPRPSPSERAVCRICPHACALAEGEVGLCRARVARGGHVVDANYGRVTSLCMDPVEKKPLARFHPGMGVLSVGSYGCNLACPFCQNASLACAGEADVAWREVTPEALVDLASKVQDNVGLAFTYNEPFVGFEFARDCAGLAHEAGLANVVVSNGMVNPQPLAEVLPLVDAANIDLKGFTQDFYDLVGGNLAAVKRTIETLASCPTCHLEVTTLVIPGLNDAEEEIDAAAAWLASLDPRIPYHLTRFFPVTAWPTPLPRRWAPCTRWPPWPAAT